MILRMFTAFFLRDFRQTVSYKFAFLLDVAGIFFNAATFYFVARLFDSTNAPALQNYGGSYFPFVLIGIAFSAYQTVGLNSFAQSIRQEQYLGTLESVLATPIRLPVFLAGSALWDFLYATGEVVLYFLIALLILGLDLSQMNLVAALVATALTLTTFMGLGILSAAFILRFKRGNPVTFLIATASELFGGVYFPTEILPNWMKAVSDWVPMTHALSALRQSLLRNASLNDISRDLWYLAGLTVIVWPLGILAFKVALKRSQSDGTLAHY